MHHAGDEKAQGIDDQVPLAAVDLLVDVLAPSPPASAVLPLCVSMMPTVGRSLRHACLRALLYRVLWIFANRPL
jgi:hypothetical protein